MKTNVTKSCGHTEEETLFGPMKERDRKIEWMQRSGLCRLCYAAQQNALRARLTAQAESASTQQGLPALTGTEKQIAWAVTIRQEWLDGQFAKIPAGHHQGEAVKTALRGAASTQVSATFWIENRLNPKPQELVDAYKSILAGGVK